MSEPPTLASRPSLDAIKEEEPELRFVYNEPNSPNDDHGALLNVTSQKKLFGQKSTYVTRLANAFEHG